MGKAIAEVYRALQDTREGGYSCISLGTTTEFIECSCGVPCLHALEVHSRSDSCSGLGELVDVDGTCEEGQMCIMDSRDQVLREKTMSLVKVLWQHRGVEEAT